MDNTEEERIDINDLKELLSEINYFDDIFSKDFVELTNEDVVALNCLIQYIDSEHNFDLSNEDDYNLLNNSLDPFMYQIVSKIPDNQKEDFFNNIKKENLLLFMNEDVVKSYPKFYTLFMSNCFGNEDYAYLFSNEYIDSFEKLFQDCPELSENINSFHTNTQITCSDYYNFILMLSKNLYTNIPEKNKGQVILSYLENTKVNNNYSFYRTDFIKNVISNDFVFRKEDLELILEQTDRIIEGQVEDLVFFDTISNHLTDDMKKEFVSHIIDIAIKQCRENPNKKKINYFDTILSRSIGSMDFSSLSNKDDVVKFFVSTNMGKSLNQSLENCEMEDITKHFEEFISGDNVNESNNGVMYAFVKNIDFSSYDISPYNLTSIVEYVMSHCDTDTLKELFQKNLNNKYSIVNYVLENQNKIPNNKTKNSKYELLQIAIDAADPEEINLGNVLKTMNYIFDYDENETLEERMKNREKTFEKFGIKMYDKNDLITSLLKKVKTENKKAVFSVFLFDPYKSTYDSYFREDYARFMNGWLNVLPQEIIEEFIQDTNCMMDRFIQQACKEPEQYSNIVNAINSVKDKTEFPDMQEFQGRIANGDVLNPEEMNDFYEKLKLIRLKNESIPEEYCDFAIRNTILAKGQKHAPNSFYQDMFTLCVIDKARHVLESEGIDDAVVFADNNSEYKCGSYNDASKMLNLSIRHIKYMSYGKYNIINTIFHEVQHAIQNKDINNNSLQNPSEYNMVKEQIIRENNMFFYDENYKSFTTEIDARIAGRQKMYAYLQNLGIPIEQILEGDIEYNKEAYKTYNEFINEEVSSLENKNKDFIVDSSERKSLDIIFDDLVVRDSTVLDKHPALKYEYKEDGTRKSSLEILQEYEDELLSTDHIQPKFNLSEHLIEKNITGDLDIQSDVMIRDAELLMKYKPKTDKGRTIVKKIIDGMHEYTLKIPDLISEKEKAGDMKNTMKLLDDSKKICDAIITYLDKSHMEFLKSIRSIDSMVTDKQREDALSQIYQAQQQSKKKSEISTEVKQDAQNKNLKQVPSADEPIEL